MKKYAKAIGYAAIYILLFMLFRQQYIDLMWEANNRWFAECDTLYGGVLIVLVCAIICYFVVSPYRKCIFGHHLLSGCLFALFLYVYFRWIDDTFYFWSLPLPWSDSSFVYIDNVVFLALVIIVQQLVAYQCARYRNKEPYEAILMKDDPICHADEDLLGYRGIVDSLLSDLENVDLGNGSFSVGITGEWGTGKSSLFCIIKERLKENKKGIVFGFNPRSSATIQEIQQDFFDGFANTLAPYHSGVHRVMKHYQEALQIVDDNWISKLFSLFTNWTVSSGKDRINEIIKETRQRVYVLVDDLDRLTASEILEVMKLIDRNGGFVNTIFITAYDKAYVNDVLRHHLKMGKNSDFTDKYFSYEYALPVQNPENLNKLAKKQIETSIIFDEDDVINQKELIKQWDEISTEIIRDLHTLRHVKRFMNILLTRYSKVKNDVNFKDFAYLTLLRYKDLSVYNAIIEGKLIRQGSKDTDTNIKLLYLRESYEDELKKIAKWERSESVLKNLFTSINGVDSQIVSNYQRLRMAGSLLTYYYDYRPGDIYYRDLICLYQAETEEKAISVLKELLRYDEDKHKCSLSRYHSIEDFLTQRPLYMLASMFDAKRLVFLLAGLMYYSWRSVEVEAFLTSLLNKRIGKVYEDAGIAGTDEVYFIEIEDAIEKTIKAFPREMASVLLKMNYSFMNFPESISESIFNPQRIINWAEWCQKLYIKEAQDDESVETIATVLEMSKIYEDKDSKQVTKAAQSEFVAYITQHANFFSSYICSIYKPHDNQGKLIITYNNSFIPSFFFPFNGVTFSSWVNENVRNNGLMNLLLALERVEGSSLTIDLKQGEYHISETNYDAVWRMIITRQEEEEEQKVKDAIKNHVALSLSVLSKDTSYKKNRVKNIIARLVKKKKLDEKMNKMADVIPPFEVGDFVMMKDVSKLKVDATGYTRNNVLKIKNIENGKYKLGDIDGIVGIDEIEAIPIDGEHDRPIYYDPIVCASVIAPGESAPIHKTDYSYYMDKFENCLDVEKRKFSDVIKDHGCQFVHEVQHWLREECGSDELKVNEWG